MITIIRLACALVTILSIRSIAMGMIEEKQDYYQHTIESFLIHKNKTAHNITFYPRDGDREVAYLDYEVDKIEKKSVYSYVCVQ